MKNKIPRELDPQDVFNVIYKTAYEKAASDGNR